MNIDFATYVREASFNLTLSSEMIEAILRLDYELKRGLGFLYGRRTSTALYRRGLIIPTTRTDVPKEWLESPNWPYCYEFTTAGNLVVGLLKEAGFKYPEQLPAREEVETPLVTLKNPSHEISTDSPQ